MYRCHRYSQSFRTLIPIFLFFWQGNSFNKECGLSASGPLMKKIGIEIRVRYVETDQMGVAHHASYFTWMEAARTELLRKNGMSYRAFEEKGFHLPVREAYCRYRKSLRYDDVMNIEATLLELGGASLKIGYKIYKIGDRIADGYTLHAFTDSSGNVVKAPRFFKSLFKS